MAYYKKALYSRIYNKIKFDPVEKFAFVITLCIVTLFSFFSCVKCYASEVEEVTYNSVSNLNISNTANNFQSQNGTNVGYFEIEKGYVYYISNNSQYQRRLAVSNAIPVLNGPYTFLANLAGGETYSYVGNGEYLYFDFAPDVSVSVTRERVNGYEGVVGDLVDNVGANQIWNVFEDGISFVGVVVLVAFGLFLVVLAIKKVSKGKSEF